MLTQIYKVKGMHCASCASIIEKTLKKIEGVHSIEVNYGTEKAKISFDTAKINPRGLSKEIEPLGYSLEIPENHLNYEQTSEEMNMSPGEHAAHTGISQSKQEKLAEVAEMKSKVMSVVPLAIFSIIVMSWDILARVGAAPEMSPTIYEFIHHLLPIFATYTLFVVGKPYLLGLFRFLRYGNANMDTLIGIGTLAAFLYSFTLTAFEEPLRQFV